MKLKITLLPLFFLLPTTQVLANDSAISDLLNSDYIKNMANAQQTNNKSVINGIDQNAITNAEEKLPKWYVGTSEIKYGKHRIVSENGESIIALIRQVFTGDAKLKNQSLMKLHGYSEQGVPEAVTFFGFLHDFGLYGVRKDPQEAMRYYEIAADRGYQPALYDMAIHAMYAMGEKQNMPAASGLLGRAMSYGSDIRVCGMQSFVNYRLNIVSTQPVTLDQCRSPLINLALAQSGHWNSLPKMVDGLRQSIGTGVDDGYQLLITVGKSVAGRDATYYYCKYALLDEFRHKKTTHGDLRADAIDCVNKTAPPSTSPTQKEISVSGITAFVPMENDELIALKKSNHFHYGWPVPYLPFNQLDVDMIAK